MRSPWRLPGAPSPPTESAHHTRTHTHTQGRGPVVFQCGCLQPRRVLAHGALLVMPPLARLMAALGAPGAAEILSNFSLSPYGEKALAALATHAHCVSIRAAPCRQATHTGFLPAPPLHCSPTIASCESMSSITWMSRQQRCTSQTAPQPWQMFPGERRGAAHPPVPAGLGRHASLACLGLDPACRLLYRGAWQEWEPWEVDLAVPLSPAELQRKMEAIWKHQSQARGGVAVDGHAHGVALSRCNGSMTLHRCCSRHLQKDPPLFPGADAREFWQQAQDRNRAKAALYDR